MQRKICSETKERNEPIIITVRLMLGYQTGATPTIRPGLNTLQALVKALPKLVIPQTTTIMLS